MAYKVTLIYGDGTGPEIVEASRRVIEATGVKFEWEVQEAGLPAVDHYGTPLPQVTIDSIRRTGLAWKGPVTTPVGTGYRSINVALRQELDLYACLRPCRTYRGVRTYFPNVDLVIVRENTEDLYAEVEFAQGEPQTQRLIDFMTELGVQRIRSDSGISIKAISIEGTRRIAKFAFDYARSNGRRKVTIVHKANIMKYSDGLFLSVAQEVAKDYPDIQCEERIVDNMCMQLVQKPELYDVLLCPNLYGDLLSDLCAGLVGGLGVAPGANIGTNGAVFEATHGSAPQYAGQNKVNPTAVILCGVMLLRHLGERVAADRVEQALADVVAEGRDVTYDLKPKPNDPTAVGTSQMADAIIARMLQRVS
ncbi:MAG: isocitrate/isopropylmalate dehydrogenase family protein [Chloroflexi bacterium]|nr:isocitrate/isopropylmalate dehydrogenase family protein [Chloroflexota bacterium]